MVFCICINGLELDEPSSKHSSKELKLVFEDVSCHRRSHMLWCWRKYKIGWRLNVVVGGWTKCKVSLYRETNSRWVVRIPCFVAFDALLHWILVEYSFILKPHPRKQICCHWMPLFIKVILWHKIKGSWFSRTGCTLDALVFWILVN